MSLSLVSTSGTFTTNIVEGDKASTIAPIVSGVAVTASGTAINFTSIPPWAKRITVMFNGVSTNGSSPIEIRLGTAAAIEATGYNGVVNGEPSTTGIRVVNAAEINAAQNFYGVCSIHFLGSNTWCSFGTLTRLNGAFSNGFAKTLAAILTRIQITTVNGTDVFDAGTINITWE